MNTLNHILGSVERFSVGINKNGQRIVTISTMILFWFLLLGAYDGQARAASDGYVDAPAVWASCSKFTNATTRDESQSLGTLGWCKTAGSVIQGVGMIGGTEIFGADAAARAEELGMTASERYGLLGVADMNVTAMLRNSPAINLPGHLYSQWVPGSGGNDGPLSVYAQGDGYVFLRDGIGLEPLWEMFRNFAYAGFTLIIIVSGFMIMFRSKIGGQVSVSIMNTIPGILVGLLLVTFSFAIVGFILDLGRLLIGVIGNYLTPSMPGVDVVGISDPIQMIRDAFSASVDSVSTGLGLSVLGGGVAGVALAIFTNPAGLLVAIVPVLILLIILGVCAYAVVKVYITMVVSYVKIFVDVILGPVYILLGSLPGKSSMITDWLKRIISNTLVFPMIFFIINLARWIGFSDLNTGVVGAASFMSGGEMSTPTIQIRGIFVIALYFVAASAPSLVNQIMAIDERGGMSGALQGSAKAASKLPIIGGMFG